MTEDQRELLMTARDSLAAARMLLGGGYPGFAASRAYYAMFYVAQAFLEGLQLSFSKHSAVIGAFGREFAHTGKVPVEVHRWLIEAQELRNDGDYGPRDTVTHEQAQQVLTRAAQFLDLAEKQIGPLSDGPNPVNRPPT
jgi:uncharacterized protein (UPF0332 family)